MADGYFNQKLSKFIYSINSLMDNLSLYDDMTQEKAEKLAAVFDTLAETVRMSWENSEENNNE